MTEEKPPKVPAVPAPEPIIDFDEDEINKVLEDENQLVTLVLRFHLHVEQLLDQLIRLKLLEAHRLLDIEQNLGFYWKVHLVDTFDVLSEKVIKSLLT